MTAPVIGLGTYVAPARWGNWGAPGHLLPCTYVERIIEAGTDPSLFDALAGAARA